MLDVSLVNGLTNPIKFNVDDGATRTLTVQANVIGVTVGGLISTFIASMSLFNNMNSSV